MRELYESTTSIPYLDNTAARLANEGRQAYQRYDLRRSLLKKVGDSLLLFTWLGDRANEALTSMLRRRGFTPISVGPAIEITGQSVDESRVIDCLIELAHEPIPTSDVLLLDVFNLRQEKWDWTLPDRLLKASFSSLRLDIASAHRWLVSHADSLSA
jgi:ATP-dependent Lhr-like helicase